MTRILKTLLAILSLAALIGTMTGCRSLVEEDPNEAQIPWATPADWEGTLPGMPGPGGF